jgi:hypothetical protein
LASVLFNHQGLPILGVGFRCGDLRAGIMGEWEKFPLILEREWSCRDTREAKYLRSSDRSGKEPRPSTTKGFD